MAKVTTYIEGAKLMADKETVHKVVAAITKAGAVYADPLMGYTFTPQIPVAGIAESGTKPSDKANVKA